MDVTIKNDGRELVMRFANGTGLHMPYNGRDKHIVTVYAPGGAVLSAQNARLGPLVLPTAIATAMAYAPTLPEPERDPRITSGTRVVWIGPKARVGPPCMGMGAIKPGDTATVVDRQGNAIGLDVHLTGHFFGWTDVANVRIDK